MSSHTEAAIPKGSIVLITGANGYLGSHIADQFLQRGYRVRGAVRDVEKNAWLAEFLQAWYGKDEFELAQVPDLLAEGAYNEVANGVSAIVHTASSPNFNPDPNQVIPEVASGTLNALRAAYAQPSVKRFVLCSSSTAAVSRAVGKPYVAIDEGSWNEDDVKTAWAEPPYTPERSWAVYCASKVQAEKEVWKMHGEKAQERPDLVVNTVLPDLCLGRALSPKHQGTPSTSFFVNTLWNGQVTPGHGMLPPQHFINAQDAARLHVAATILPHVQGQRLFGFVKPFNWDGVLDIMRKKDPSRKLPDNFSGEVDGTDAKPSAKAEELLRELGVSGWMSLEETIEGAVAETDA